MWTLFFIWFLRPHDYVKIQDDTYAYGFPSRETEVDLSKNMDVSDSGILLCPECKFDTKEENNFEDH